MAPDTVSTTLRELSAKITLDNQELFANHAEQLKFQDYFKGLVVIFFTIRFKTEHSSDPTVRIPVHDRGPCQGLTIVKARSRNRSPPYGITR